MKKYVLASAVALGALYGSSVQAAPITSNPSAVQDHVATSVQKGWHCRSWSGGWGCGHGGSGGHYRWRSHYRWGSRGW
jgi:hypothetical protein